MISNNRCNGNLFISFFMAHSYPAAASRGSSRGGSTIHDSIPPRPGSGRVAINRGVGVYQIRKRETQARLELAPSRTLIALVPMVLANGLLCFILCAAAAAAANADADAVVLKIWPAV